MGISHLLSDKEQAKKSFENEWKSVEGDEGRIFEKIHPQDKIVRLHLEPLKKRGDDYEKIWSLVTESAKEFEPDPKLRNYLINNLLTAPFLEKKGFSAQRIIKFREYISSQNFPVIHHSRAYKKAYKPHYRLIVEKHKQVLQDGNEI